MRAGVGVLRLGWRMGEHRRDDGGLVGEVERFGVYGWFMMASRCGRSV